MNAIYNKNHFFICAVIAIFSIIGFLQPVFAGCPGCCSSHGGISSSCSSNGRIYCMDGTVSPSCSCSSCGVSGGSSSPSCYLTATPSSIVAGSFSTLYASCSPAANSYSWTNSNLSSTSSSGAVYPTITTTYGVTGTNSTGTGNFASATVTVTAALKPSCNLSAFPTSIPSGSSSTLSATCTPIATSYTWTGGTCAGTTGATCTITPTSTSTYTVTGTNAGGTGTAASTTVTVTTPICSGGQSWNGTACACPAGKNLVDGECYSPAPATTCGVERWSIKTGTDVDATKVNTITPLNSSVFELISLTTPTIRPESSRISPVELNTYVVDATLTDYRFTEDSDYHVVITDSAGRTMIVELPHPDCVTSTGIFRDAIIAARNSFDSRLRASTSYKTTSIPVRVYGVGFFDEIHGQRGVAPNGIELHPVLKIEFDFSPKPLVMQEVVEYHNSENNHYFMTSNKSEADGIDAGAAGAGWRRTGNSFKAWPTDTNMAGVVPVCRFYSRGANSHFFTANPQECSYLSTLEGQQKSQAASMGKEFIGWSFEGTPFGVKQPSSNDCPSDTQPIYRAYNHREAMNDQNHRFSSQLSDIENLVANGWIFEGVAMCASY